MFDSLREPVDVGVLPLEDLDRLVADVDALALPIEGVFVAIGDRLGSALDMLGRLQPDLSGLSRELESAAGRQAEQALVDAAGQCGRLSGTSGRTGGILSHVAETVRSSTVPAEALRKTFGEVSALAINARIQAAQISAESIDFTVFTTEIGRLHRLADGAVAQAIRHLDQLRHSIAAGCEADDAFQRQDAKELDRVRERLERGISAFADRRQRARAAMVSIGERSDRIARRVAESIAQMQVNDLTRQRLEHVRDALKLLRTMGLPTGAAWVMELDIGRRKALMAAVCRLQEEQLERASRDFAAEVARMTGNIRALADDAAETMREAASLFAGTESGGSFLLDLGRDTDEALCILDAYTAASGRVRDAIAGVLDGFDAVSKDIRTVHTVDTDMRIMGLNASFKCARLGSQGRALGIVAQELRVCSRRTQEASEAIVALVAGARDEARQLAEWVEGSQSQAAALRAAISTSMQSLQGLGTGVHAMLGHLTATCERLWTVLGEIAEGITIHHETEAASKRIAASLGGLAAMLAAGSAEYGGLDEDVRRLLEKQYTMASERVIHGLAETAAEPAAAPAVDDIDQFFL